MKISICGKGGSGKSTIAKLMVDAFKKLGKEVTIGTIHYYNEILAAGLEGKPFAVSKASTEMEGIVKSYFQ